MLSLRTVAWSAFPLGHICPSGAKPSIKELTPLKVFVCVHISRKANSVTQDKER